VRQFRNPHELALEVTTSFVQLIRDRPAVGYVSADAAVDFKRYSELLEENSRLKEALSAAQQSLVVAPFPAHQKPIRLTIVTGYGQSAAIVGIVECSLKAGFSAVAEASLLDQYQDPVLHHAATLLLGDDPKNKDPHLGLHPESVRTLRRELVLYGLFDVTQEEHSAYSPSMGTVPRSVILWKLTDYGRRQLAAIAP
jgi:hypothetical protein